LELKIKDIDKAKYIPLAETVIKEWLEELKQDRVSEFEGNLSILSRFLKESGKRIGILIDNLEPALNQDGEFIEKHRKYVQLLEVLADSSVRSLTLITSRELLHENINNTEQYSLECLTYEAWDNFFKYWEIKTNPEDLAEIYTAYKGNALAMNIFEGEIRKHYHSNLGLFWQGERKDSLIENSDLSKLVSEQFKRLESLDFDTYQLLYRLGCYRYQDFPSLPEKGLLSLLWDKPESERIKIIYSLRDRSLVEFDCDQYSLHPIILAKSHLLLKDSEEFKDVHANAASFYAENAKDITNSTEVKYAFEAMYHYYEAEDFSQCHQTLLHILDSKEKTENLRCSENLWLYIPEIISWCDKLKDKLTGLDKAINLIPLGVLYPEVGKNSEAVKISGDILTIIGKLTESKEPNERIILAKASAYLISGRANKFIGDFSESFKACKEARESVREARLKVDKYMLWEGLALYELGTAHLERAKLKEFYSQEAVKAFIFIFRGALFSVGSQKISAIFYVIYIFLTSPEPEIRSRLKYTVNHIKYGKQNKSRDSDYTKEFRVIYNLARCITAMKFPGNKWLANAVFDRALKVIGDRQDPLNRTWSYLGLAMCLPNNKAKIKYEESLENFNKLSTLCKASFLFDYGSFKYKEGKIKEAIEQHIALKELLEREGADFEALAALNYYRIGQTYLDLCINDRLNINDTHHIDGSILADYQDCIKAYQKLDLPDKSKVMRLEPKIQKLVSNSNT
jgi:hypothetical protein